MDAFYSYLNKLLSEHKATYAQYPQLKWLNPYEASAYQEQRNLLLSQLNDTPLFKDTKPFYKQISKGCQLCGAGLWSCLFITGKCNGNCFYCPTSQAIDELPSSQGLTFLTPASYAEYVNHFGFKGVSFSGGEPLLYADRVLNYLKAVRQMASPDIYTWMYTNGILAESKVFKALASAGLNEIRFDIGATNYQLDKILLAKGIIPKLTIEIPAVPEEKEQLMALLPKMVKAGVTNLNLHQLRLTPYNVAKLSKHPYTYVAAEKPIVLESELAALEIMVHAQKLQLPIGVNYCSFFFKNRFQSAGFRKLAGAKLPNVNGIATERGYFRSFQDGKISYQNAQLFDAETFQNETPNFLLKHKAYYYRLGMAHQQNKAGIHNTADLQAYIQSISEVIPENSIDFEIWRHEYIEKGLRNY
jgi:pyruvate formate-lyase activating enzyme-like uncharacterized protein